MKFHWYKMTPLRREPPWSEKTDFHVVNFVVNVLWLLRILSPAAWILSALADEEPEKNIGHSAGKTELYVVGVNIIFLTILLVAPIYLMRSRLFSVIILIFILETCQYHVYLMIIRPEIDRHYRQYSFSRTIILTLISYQGLITLFALLYMSSFFDSFNGLSAGQTDLTRTSAWAVSAGILTGTGFSGIAPKPGSPASVVGGIESIVGILFLTTILSLAVSRGTFRHN